MLSAVGSVISAPVRRISSIFGIGVYEGSAESVEVAMAQVGARASIHMEEGQAEENMYDESCNDDKVKPGDKTSRSFQQRCRSRNMQKLFNACVLVNDTAVMLAICSMLMMVVDNIWILRGVYEETSIPSIGLRACISVMTILLVGCVAHYHSLRVRLFLHTHNSDDWQLVAAIQKPLAVFIELFFYSLHPLPYVHYVAVNTTYMAATESYYETIVVSVNVFLSVAMFSRFYLILRYLALNSMLQKHCFLLTVVPMNGVKFGMSFMCKSYLKRNSTLVLAIMAVTCLVSLTWLMSMVEQRQGNDVMTLQNAAWNILVTTIALGYGDIVPASYTGRILSVVTGMFGTGCMALVMATMMRNLQLSRRECNVLKLLAHSDLLKQRRIASAEIIQYGWLWHRYKMRCDKGRAKRFYELLQAAIYTMKQLRLKKWRMEEDSDSKEMLAEIMQTQKYFCESATLFVKKQEEQCKRLDLLEMTLARFEDKLDILLDSCLLRKSVRIKELSDA